MKSSRVLTIWCWIIRFHQQRRKEPRHGHRLATAVASAWLGGRGGGAGGREGREGYAVAQAKNRTKKRGPKDRTVATRHRHMRCWAREWEMGGMRRTIHAILSVRFEWVRREKIHKQSGSFILNVVFFWVQFSEWMKERLLSKDRFLGWI